MTSPADKPSSKHNSFSDLVEETEPQQEIEQEKHTDTKNGNRDRINLKPNSLKLNAARPPVPVARVSPSQAPKPSLAQPLASPPAIEKPPMPLVSKVKPSPLRVSNPLANLPPTAELSSSMEKAKPSPKEETASPVGGLVSPKESGSWSRQQGISGSLERPVHTSHDRLSQGSANGPGTPKSPTGVATVTDFVDRGPAPSAKHLDANGPGMETQPGSRHASPKTPTSVTPLTAILQSPDAPQSVFRMAKAHVPVCSVKPVNGNNKHKISRAERAEANEVLADFALSEISMSEVSEMESETYDRKPPGNKFKGGTKATKHNILPNTRNDIERPVYPLYQPPNSETDLDTDSQVETPTNMQLPSVKTPSPTSSTATNSTGNNNNARMGDVQIFLQYPFLYSYGKGCDLDKNKIDASVKEKFGCAPVDHFRASLAERLRETGCNAGMSGKKDLSGLGQNTTFDALSDPYCNKLAMLLNQSVEGTMGEATDVLELDTDSQVDDGTSSIDVQITDSEYMADDIDDIDNISLGNESYSDIHSFNVSDMQKYDNGNEGDLDDYSLSSRSSHVFESGSRRSFDSIPSQSNESEYDNYQPGMSDEDSIDPQAISDIDFSVEELSRGGLNLPDYGMSQLGLHPSSRYIQHFSGYRTPGTNSLSGSFSGVASSCNHPTVSAVSGVPQSSSNKINNVSQHSFV